MGRRLRVRAIRLMKQLDVEAVDYLELIERELRERLGREVASLRQPDSTGPRDCRSCGIPNDADAAFCKGCGKAL